MRHKDNGTPGWEKAARAALRDLDLASVPGFEILFLDDLAGWAYSVSNPGRGYSEAHSALVVSALLEALERARSFRPARVPEESPEIAAVRGKIVAGAHDFAAADGGLAQLVGLLAPAVVRELEHNAGQPAVQTYWLYHYALLVLACGTAGEATEETLRGITAAFRAWDELAAAGYALPWRTPQGVAAQASADMVTSHVETLIEQLTGADKAQADADGDYPIRYRSALYFVRIVRAWKPVVQIFSVAIDGVRFTDALARDLNGINARLHFCRAFWVHDQVLIEAELLGPSLNGADFHECALHVAEATDTFAKELAERHGGRLAFEEAKAPEYAPPAEERLGYL